MIYKTKKEYYSLERRNDQVVKIKRKGYKIVVKEETFFVDPDNYKITDGETGTGMPPFPNAPTLEDVEKQLEESVEEIKQLKENFKNARPELTLDKVEEWKD